MKRVVIVSLALAALAGAGFGRTAVSSKEENLQSCLDGFDTCDRSFTDINTSNTNQGPAG